MSNYVFVLDTHKRPLNPVHPGAARHLLNTGKAAVFRRYPFTIILKEACPDVPVQDLQLGLDPGSKVTGIAIKQGHKVIFGAELQHRGNRLRMLCCPVVNCGVLDGIAKLAIAKLDS